MKSIFHLRMAFWILILLAACDRDNTAVGSDPIAPAGSYRNGLYEASLPADYEGYSTAAAISVTANRIVVVNWSIYDERNRRYFDDTYEEVYTGNPVYIQQCRDDRRGMAIYSERLIETQELDSVDCVTHATWSYNKFKSVAGKALKDARLDTTEEKE